MLLVQSTKTSNRTLNDVLASLTGNFFIVTRKQFVDREKVIEFVNEARQKNMNDFNIAGLIKHEELGFLTRALK